MQTREIAFDSLKQLVFLNIVVLMPQDVAEIIDFPPRLIRRRGTRLEDNSAIPFYLILETLFAYRLRNHIDPAAEQPGEALLKLFQLPEIIEAATGKIL